MFLKYLHHRPGRLFVYLKQTNKTSFEKEKKVRKIKESPCTVSKKSKADNLEIVSIWEETANHANSSAANSRQPMQSPPE